MLGKLCLDVRVGVVDDGQEHVEQHEEDEEHVQEEVDGSEDTLGGLHGPEVEVTQDDTEQSETERQR